MGRQQNISFSENEFIEVFRTANKRTSLGEKTVHTYALRMLRWFIGARIIQSVQGQLIFNESTHSNLFTLEVLSRKKLRSSDVFLGETSPHKTVEAFKAICGSPSPITRTEITSQFGRNTCYVLMKLNLMNPDGTLLSSVPTELAKQLIAERVKEFATIKHVQSIISENASLSPLDIGASISEKFRMNWSRASKLRYGNALRQWARWSSGIDNSKQEQLILLVQ